MNNSIYDTFWYQRALRKARRFDTLLTLFGACLAFCAVMLIFTHQVSSHRSSRQTLAIAESATAISTSTHSSEALSSSSLIFKYAFSRRLYPVLTWSIGTALLLAFFLSNILTGWKRFRKTCSIMFLILAFFAITKTLAICYVRLL